MHLEIITRQPKTNAGMTPLLFVHGMFCSAWVWENFLAYFAEHGYEAHAVSLRGHGSSEGRERIRLIRSDEYVEDVAHVAGRLRSAPVLIGHSMGGYVIQKYLEKYAVPAVVLLASVPPAGTFKMLVRQSVRHPWKTVKCHMTWNPYAMIETPRLARKVFFSDDMPFEMVNRHFARFQNEPYRAALEATFFNLPRPDKINPLPMLVLSGANDVILSREEVESTARAYRTQAEFIPNIAHFMMLEADWMKVAERILTWLREKGL